MGKKFPPYVENLIASLRSIPREYVASYDSSDSQYVGNLIERLQKKFNLEETRAQDIIMANWKAIIGEPYAHRCCPQSFYKGALVIKVSSSVLRNELEFYRGKILENLRKLPQCTEAKEVVFRAG